MRQRYYNPEIKRFINQDILTGSTGNSQSRKRQRSIFQNDTALIEMLYLASFGANPIENRVYRSAAGNLISNTASFAKTADYTKDVGIAMYEKYMVQKQEFKITDSEARDELLQLGLGLVGMRT